MSYDGLNGVVLEMFRNKSDKLNSSMSLNLYEIFSLLFPKMFDDKCVVLHDEHEYDEQVHLSNEIVLNILHTNSMHLLKQLSMIDVAKLLTMD